MNKKLGKKKVRKFQKVIEKKMKKSRAKKRKRENSISLPANKLTTNIISTRIFSSDANCTILQIFN